jgi:5-methylcytosine-specific restriction protein B
VDVEDQNFVIKICSQLQSINEILQEANSHVGYRVRDEIVFYMLNNKKSGLLAENEAMDNEIMQKILPRIQGSGISVKELLIALFKNFAGDYSGISQDSVWRQMDKYIKDKECVYKKSAEKICYMMRRFEEDGFTSYWL